MKRAVTIEANLMLPLPNGFAWESLVDLCERWMRDRTIVDASVFLRVFGFELRGLKSQTMAVDAYANLVRTYPTRNCPYVEFVEIKRGSYTDYCGLRIRRDSIEVLSRQPFITALANAQGRPHPRKFGAKPLRGWLRELVQTRQAMHALTGEP